MRAILFALGWAASVAAAFLVGRSLAPGGATEAPGAGGVDRFSEEAAVDAGPMLAPGRTPAPGSGAGTTSEGATPDATAPGEEARAGETLEPFTLEGVTDPDVAMARLMRHVAALLAKGREGHLELLRFIDEHVADSDELERFFHREEDAVRYLVPWVEFLVARKGQVVDVADTVFETMAERPEELAEIDKDTLEIFTEGFAVVLPGAVDEKRLATFRGYARKILETPEGTLPEPVERQRRRIQQALLLWAPRLTPEDAVARIRSGQLTGSEAIRALQGLSAEQLAGLDLGALAAPVLASGDYRTLRMLRDLPLQQRDIALLDDTLLKASADGKAREWVITEYLGITDRWTWPAPQALVERGLGLGGDATEVWARALGRIRAPSDYARWVLETYRLSEETAKFLKARFQLE